MKKMADLLSPIHFLCIFFIKLDVNLIFVKL